MRSGKVMLRDLLARYVPRPLFERPKMGFEVPIGAWLRGPLRCWANDILDERELERGGVFDTRAVRRVLDDHLAGRADHPHLLWNLLMFEAWRREWRATI